MAFADIYKRQVTLLIRVLPQVTEEACFALKGRTAINSFVRDLPRLSVDIDLIYLPVAPRTAATMCGDLGLSESAISRCLDHPHCDQ
jgi:hypothetical protein